MASKRTNRQKIKAILAPTGDKLRDDFKVMLLLQAFEDKLGQIMNTDPSGYANQIVSLEFMKDIARESYEIIINQGANQ